MTWKKILAILLIVVFPICAAAEQGTPAQIADTAAETDIQAQEPIGVIIPTDETETLGSIIEEIEAEEPTKAPADANPEAAEEPEDAEKTENPETAEPAQTVFADPEVTPAPSVETVSTTPAPEKKAEKEKEPVLLSDDDLVLQYGETVFQLGDSPEKIVREMDKQENPYTIIEDRQTVVTTGKSKSYESETLAVLTNPNDEQNEEISSVFVDGRDIETARGIKVGDPFSEVEKRYGKSYDKEPGDLIVYRIKNGKNSGSVILFQLDDDNTILSYVLIRNYIPSK